MISTNFDWETLIFLSTNDFDLDDEHDLYRQFKTNFQGSKAIQHES